MNDFILSDTHFFHKNIIEYASRPFDNVEEMNEALIKNWNSVVTKQDRVWHLGDVCFCGKKKAESIIRRLNGKKILIKGNHDNNSNQWYLDIGFDQVYNHSVLLHQKYLLTHFPLDGLTGTTRGHFINVHGHIHEKIIKSPGFFNVSVEQRDYTPFRFSKIREIYEGK